MESQGELVVQVIFKSSHRLDRKKAYGSIGKGDFYTNYSGNWLQQILAVSCAVLVNIASILWIHNMDPENQAKISPFSKSTPQEVEDEIAALNTDLGDLKLVVRSGKCCLLDGAQRVEKKVDTFFFQLGEVDWFDELLSSKVPGSQCLATKLGHTSKYIFRWSVFEPAM